MLAVAVFSLWLTIAAGTIHGWLPVHDSDCKISILDLSQEKGFGLNCNADSRLAFCLISLCCDDRVKQPPHDRRLHEQAAYHQWSDCGE